MNIDIDIMVEKYNNCVKALNPNKCCQTCAYEHVDASMLPCRDCYGELIGLPVDPTNWEEKIEAGEEPS